MKQCVCWLCQAELARRELLSRRLSALRRALLSARVGSLCCHRATGRFGWKRSPAAASDESE